MPRRRHLRREAPRLSVGCSRCRAADATARIAPRALACQALHTGGRHHQTRSSFVQSSRRVSQPLLNRSAWLACSGEQPIASSTCDGFSEPLEHAEPVDTAAPSLSSFTTQRWRLFKGGMIAETVFHKTARRRQRSLARESMRAGWRRIRHARRGAFDRRLFSEDSFDRRAQRSRRESPRRFRCRHVDAPVAGRRGAGDPGRGAFQNADALRPAELMRSDAEKVGRAKTRCRQLPDPLRASQKKGTLKAARAHESRATVARRRSRYLPPSQQPAPVAARAIRARASRPRPTRGDLPG